MVITSTMVNAINSKPEKLGDSSSDVGDSNSSENLEDSPTVCKNLVESRFPIEDESDQPKEGDEEEEERECGFCVYMKAGGCKESFMAWEVCMEDAKKNKENISKCMEVTSTLYKCMDAHSGYYQPILFMEIAAAEQVKKEFEAKKNKVEEEEEEEEEVVARKRAEG